MLEELKAFLHPWPPWLKAAIRLFPPLNDAKLENLDHDLILRLWAFIGVMLPPFLFLLLAPAVLPRVFPDVPREIPSALSVWVGEKQNDTWLLLPRLIGGAVWVSGIAIGLALTIIMLWAVSMFKMWIDRCINLISSFINDIYINNNLKIISAIRDLIRSSGLMNLNHTTRYIDALVTRTIDKIGKKERWERPWLVLLGMSIGFCILAILAGLGVGVSWYLVIPYYSLALGLFIFVFQLSPEEFPRIGPVTPQAWIPMDEVKRLATIAAFFVLAVALYIGLCVVWGFREIASWALSFLLVPASLVLLPTVLVSIRAMVGQRGGGWTSFVQKSRARSPGVVGGSVGLRPLVRLGHPTFLDLSVHHPRRLDLPANGSDCRQSRGDHLLQEPCQGPLGRAAFGIRINQQF